MRLSQRTTDQIDSPIGTTYALLDGHEAGLPLLDLAQAAPAWPPAPEVRDHIVAVASSADGANYVEIDGLPHLREAFAAELRTDYLGQVTADDVLVTAGCNQAFCLAISALAEPGDEVLLPVPYYFNHDMWLRLQGVRPVHLEAGPALVPDVDTAAAAITSRTRAIVLVSPGNPSGVTIAPDQLDGFATLAAGHDLALVIDETYRNFRGTDEPAHTLFQRPRWRDTVVSLHSFSKDLAIPGYRVGAVVGSPAVNRQIAKSLDCLAICAPRVGQEAVVAGLRHAGRWRRERARDVAERRHAFEATMAARPGGFELVSCGAYFGWVRHPFPGRPTAEVVRHLVAGCDVLTVPGTAFMPDDRRMLRMTFANLEPQAFADLASRLGTAGARLT